MPPSHDAFTPPAVMALDIGTSSVRASLYDRTLTAHRSIQVRYRWDGSTPAVELPAGKLLRTVTRAIDELLTQRMPPVEAVSIAAFWHSLLGVDSAGRPLTPLLPWSDRRAADESSTLAASLDEPALHRATGCRLHASYWPARLRWFARHERAVFRSVARWVSFTEWLEQQWLGRDGVSLSQASATGLLNQDRCRWDEAALEASRIGEGCLAPIIGLDDHATLRPHLAARWPALANARWIPAVGDGALNNVGAGCVRRHRAVAMIGTSAAMRTLWRPRAGESLTVPYALWRYRLDHHRVIVGGALSSGGNVREWVLRVAAGRQDDPRVNRDAQDDLQRLADALDPAAHGLAVLPHLAGTRSPDYLDDARGTIHGLTLDTRPEHLLRALMEAVAYRLAALADELRKIVRTGEIVAAGGGLERSSRWTQILADTLGRSVRLCAAAELTSRGAAALALEQLGVLRLDDVEPPPGDMLTPDRTRTRIYRAARKKQEALQSRLGGL